MSMQLSIRTILFFILLISTSSANEIFISLKKNKVNVRYGPGFDYPTMSKSITMRI